MTIALCPLPEYKKSIVSLKVNSRPSLAAQGMPELLLEQKYLFDVKGNSGG
jgi:hypothetical protein